ncbi:hypothetical protein ACFYO7_22710 [Nocardia salmonicida]
MSGEHGGLRTGFVERPPHGRRELGTRVEAVGNAFGQGAGEDGVQRRG